MISNQMIQTSLDELKAITKVDLSVYEPGGVLVAATSANADVTAELVAGFAESLAESQVISNQHLMKIYDDGELLYVIVAKGMSDDAYMVGRIAVCQLQNLAIAYRERYDRNSFFQNLLLDNLLLVDIHNRARKLHLAVNVPRAVFLVETVAERDSIVTELLRGMFSGQAGDHVTSVDERSVILIKEIGRAHV